MVGKSGENSYKRIKQGKWKNDENELIQDLETKVDEELVDVMYEDGPDEINIEYENQMYVFKRGEIKEVSISLYNKLLKTPYSFK